MDTIKAILMGELYRAEEQRVFDWDKAARLIKEHKPQCAIAGLEDDFMFTGGVIYQDGKPAYDERTYLSSTWAIPQLIMDSEVYDCFRMQSELPEQDAETKWPASALAILS